MNYLRTQKTTSEIRILLTNAKLDFDSVVNKALNHYLSTIFHSCPFTEELCTTKQCVECSAFIKPHKEKKSISTSQTSSFTV